LAPEKDNLVSAATPIRVGARSVVAGANEQPRLNELRVFRVLDAGND
jgi:hypothetical protein